jgi:hypothetical protein
MGVAREPFEPPTPAILPEPRTWVRKGGAQLDAIARSLSAFGAPVVVFGAAHSGGALMSRLLQRLGVFMGSDLSDSEETREVAELVRYLGQVHAPDFTPLLEEGDPALPARVRTAFHGHLAERPGAQRWGWKLPETGHVLPVIARLFPEARFVHLVRDGRDVAFSPADAPHGPLVRGLAMIQRIDGHLANARRWATGATLGRAHGVMLGERYLEVRYEALVAEPAGELARVAEFLGIEGPRAAHETMDVYATSVGKWRERPAREMAERCAQPGGLGGLFRVRGKR